MYISHRPLDFSCCHSARDETMRALRELIAKFKHYGAEIYLVGGCVRDALLGKPCHDFDLTTNLTPDEMLEMLEKEDPEGLWKTASPGKNFGTLVFVRSKGAMTGNSGEESRKPGCSVGFEVTTFRAESGYEDHRKPSNVRFSESLEEDLKRRDFTINSFAYDLPESNLYTLDRSYLGDLHNRIVRAVGDPSERFEEDALRMLRAFRFACQLNGDIDPATYKGIKENAGYLSKISTERIRDELNKIVMSPAPEKIMLMKDSGLAIEGLGNLWKASNAHQIASLMSLAGSDSAKRWAAFFYGLRLNVNPASELGSANIAYDEYEKRVRLWMINMKFDNRGVDQVQRILAYCDRMAGDGISKKAIKRMLGERHDDEFVTAARIAASAMEFQNLPGAHRYGWIMEIARQAAENREPVALGDLAVNGLDMLQIGLVGKQIGEALDNCLDLVLERPEANTKPFLLKHVRQRRNQSHA